MAQPSSDLLAGLLKGVSRSFYLTLRFLPRAVRPQISLAYLLARASDTIADTDAVSKDDRLTILQLFGDRVAGRSKLPLPLDALAGSQSSSAERLLLQRIEEALAFLGTLFPSDLERVRQVLTVIISGQVLDVQRFAGATVENIAALTTDNELDDYTYRVAGCVGEFWTHMCLAHLFPEEKDQEDVLLRDGLRFGKGLQLVNILRDIPEDLRMGRCYLPKEQLAKSGFLPRDLLDARNETRLQPLYQGYLDRAQGHLEAGWSYTNALPRRSWRVRLACAWPVLIGLQTLSKLRTGPVLGPAQRIKISRGQVRQVLVRSVLLYPFQRRWHALGKTSRLPETGCGGQRL